MEASIIIPTLNRHEIILQTLKYFENQTDSNFEIILVDQSDELLNFKKLPKKLAKKIKYIQLTLKSAANARNVGAQQAKGDILIFIDDDVQFDENFIESHIKSYYGNISAVQGFVRQMRDIREGLKNRFRVSNFFLTPVNKYKPLEKQKVNDLIGCNFSVKRKIFLKLGGMDLNYIGNGYFEESDFAYRLVKNN